MTGGLSHIKGNEETTADQEENHWENLGIKIGQYIEQVADTRLSQLYQKLYAEGWHKRTLPMSTRNSDEHIKLMILDAVAVEIIERREGRIPSVPGD